MILGEREADEHMAYESTSLPHEIFLFPCNGDT